MGAMMEAAGGYSEAGHACTYVDGGSPSRRNIFSPWMRLSSLGTQLDGATVTPR